MNGLHIVSASTAAAAASAAPPSANSTNNGSSADAAADPAAFGNVLGAQLDAAASRDSRDPRSDASPADADKLKAQDESAVAIDPATLNLGLDSQAGAQAVPTLASPLNGKGDSDKDSDADISTLDPRSKAGERKSARTPDAAAISAKKDAQHDDTALPILAKAEHRFELAPTTNGDSHQALAALQGAHSAPAAAAPDKAVAMTLQNPVGTERWNNELGQSVTMLMRGEHASAALHVTPPDLGPISVRIDMSGDQASISFNVQHADTRQALQNALPQLRDMLADSGISLGQAQVNQQSGGQQQQPDSSNLSRDHSDGGTLAPLHAGENVRVQAQRIGLVDTFA
jgi:flagellar hook-length control protein FliK